MKSKKKVLAAILAGCMTVSLFSIAPAYKAFADGDSIEDIKKDKEENESKTEEAKAKLEDLKAQQQDLLDTIAELDGQIDEYQGKVTSLTEEKNTIQAKVAITENNLQDAYIAETNQYASMKERIQFAYENGDVEYIDALMSIKDYSSITNQSEYVSQISAYDQEQLNTLAEIEQQIDSYQSDLQESLAKVSDLKAAAEEEMGALEVLQEGKQEMLGNTEDDIDLTEEEIAELQAQHEQQEASIDSLIAQAEAQRKAAASTVSSSSSGSTVQYQTVTKTVTETVADPTATSGDATKTVTTTVTEQVPVSNNTSSSSGKYNTWNGGSMSWPIPGHYYVSSGLGTRWGSPHNGIDIPAPIGTPVYACADGYVITAQSNYYNCGNAILISHGNGATSMYYHLSGFAVSAGQNVSKGQLIGYSGNTGFSTGPHLHWGLRVNGSYVDPRSY